MSVAAVVPQASTGTMPKASVKRAGSKSWLNVHRLYGGRLAMPIPATIAHGSGMVGVLARTGTRESLPGALVLLAAGFAAWTLFEYALHRWILHSRNPVLWRILHKEHHSMRVMEDQNHRLMHPFIAVPLMGGATMLLPHAGGPVVFGIGFWIGYVTYELIHWVHHDARLTQSLSRFAYFRRRVVFHHDHHFRRADTHYGFTTGFWDHVFGTARNTSRFTNVRSRVAAAAAGQVR
jgi:sterol desaturase/sphingolipid hydroxylase (fatty acid hydroxylase superfamily)